VSDQNAISVTGLHKSYVAGVPVLADFDFELRSGEVHALMGSNGAGKSTLANILTGLTPRNSGQILLHGQDYQPATKADAAAAGVIMVLQELNLIPTLSVAENLFLHNLPSRRGVVSRKRLREKAGAALESVGLIGIDPDTPASRLGVGQQQLVEIAGALAQRSSVLILDEPTAALTGPEIDLLFENIRRLKAEGGAIVYISHRMDEIARISDRVTVMRDGRRISTHRTTEVESRQLVHEMAGSEIAERSIDSSVQSDREDEPGLVVKNLRSGTAVRGVSFVAHRGEILGIAGLVGSGRSETLRAIYGADRLESGSVALGESVPPLRLRSAVDGVRAGMALIPEDRKHDGLLLDKSLTRNATLATMADHTLPGGRLNFSSENAAAEKVFDRLEVKRESISQAAGTLSGGNQQKVVLARWILRDSKVMLFDEPTRGVDVAAKEAIYQLLDEFAAADKTVVVVSSDLSELMSISQRIVVMSAGQIAGEFLPGTEQWTQAAITEAAFSGYLDAGNREGEAA